MLPAHKCCQMGKLEGQSISPVNADAIFTIPELFSLLLILCLARFINPVYTEKLDQSDMLTKCMSIYLHIHFSFFLTNFPTKNPNIWNVWGFFPPHFIFKKKKKKKIQQTQHLVLQRALSGKHKSTGCLTRAGSQEFCCPMFYTHSVPQTVPDGFFFGSPFPTADPIACGCTVIHRTTVPEQQQLQCLFSKSPTMNYLSSLRRLLVACRKVFEASTEIPFMTLQ